MQNDNSNRTSRTVDDGAGRLQLDHAELVERLGGDREAAGELVGLFLQEWPQMVERVRESVTAGSASELYFAAHALKGMVANFNEGEAMQAARELEAIGRAGTVTPQAAALVAALDRHMSRLDAGMRHFLAEGGSSPA
jgi:HPt (histidine-containing phosphotransfer) domain-containing protein